MKTLKKKLKMIVEKTDTGFSAFSEEYPLDRPVLCERLFSDPINFLSKKVQALYAYYAFCFFIDRLGRQVDV